MKIFKFTALCLLFSFLVVLSVPAQEIHLTFYYPVGVSGPLVNVINGMVEEFSKTHPGIVVEPVYAGNYNNTMQKVQTAVLGGNPPDIAVVEISELFSLLAMDSIIPLDDYIEAEGGQEFLDQFFPAFFGNAKAEGKIYGFPFQRSTPVLYWNKDAFKASADELTAAGLDPNRAPQNWDELAAYSKILTKREGNETKQYGVILPGGWNDWIFEAFSRQNGSQLLKEDGKTVTFDTPENLEALKLWADLMITYKTSPVLRPWNITPEDFIAGISAMMYYSTGGMTQVRELAKFDFGVAFLPAKKQFGTPVGGGDFHIFKGIPKENQDAAWEFIKFMTNPEQAGYWSRASGYVAVNKKSYELPEMQTFLEEFPQMAVARDQLEYAYPKMMAVNYQLIRNAMTSNLDAAMEGKITPEETLKILQQKVEEILAE
ncbi:extracellular solute-binding protein family 1 [Candidatus Vecturithrix granuli]|uniref:Extracellular solute-binding protein family 1 n=1 Tax=Vecturithrix granuli TaxID=1499967 RepID=A0A081BU47_VECG1|nr:extracellular solute-binding protein family 1 [Candidatus Vecturithrix granuli]